MRRKTVIMRRKPVIMRRKPVIPADGGLRGGKLRRESKDLRGGTKSAINYVHLLMMI